MRRIKKIRLFFRSNPELKFIIFVLLITLVATVVYNKTINIKDPGAKGRSYASSAISEKCYIHLSCEGEKNLREHLFLYYADSEYVDLPTVKGLQNMYPDSIREFEKRCYRKQIIRKQVCSGIECNKDYEPCTFDGDCCADYYCTKNNFCMVNLLEIGSSTSGAGLFLQAMYRKNNQSIEGEIAIEDWEEKLHIYLHDNKGDIIMGREYYVEGRKRHPFVIDVSGFSEGEYLLTLKTAKGNRSMRVRID